MFSILTAFTQNSDLEVMVPLMGLGVGIGIAVGVGLFISVWYLVLAKMRREEELPRYYYNQKKLVKIKELRRKLAENRKKSA